MKYSKRNIAAILFMAILSTGCVSTGEHQRVVMEAEETLSALRECQKSLVDSEGRVEKLTEANSLLTQQSKEIIARRETLGELVAECEFAVRERDDEYREQAAALRELERELDARQRVLKPLLDQQKAHEDLLRAVETLVSDLMVVFSAQIEDGQVSVSSLGTRALLTINNKLLYRSYGTRLTAEGKKLLGRAADSFKRIGVNSLRLEAYTDNILPREKLKETYPSNWDLSAARAASAAFYLVSEEGVPQEIVVASGHSDNSPLADNSELEGRVANRRLVLAATPEVKREPAPEEIRPD